MPQLGVVWSVGRSAARTSRRSSGSPWTAPPSRAPHTGPRRHASTTARPPADRQSRRQISVDEAAASACHSLPSAASFICVSILDRVVWVCGLVVVLPGSAGPRAWHGQRHGCQAAGHRQAGGSQNNRERRVVCLSVCGWRGGLGEESDLSVYVCWATTTHSCSSLS